ncbi:MULTISPECIES: RNA polymerase factor sigma-54 [Luteimonas]|uniref:RNA polymerase factor sigma-54 n=1 Tax=Luteimonas TaxID=83614 RepID=UPI000C7C530C|nr:MULTISPECIES: RNA polymerase factor sigma-54 [Luteimonas]
MKGTATTSLQFGQQLHMTPQLLQSIRLLQLDGLQLELEIRRVMEQNPLLDLDDASDAPVVDAAADATIDVAAFDELPESSMWDVRGAGWDGDDDGLQRIAAQASSDPQLRILQAFAMDAGLEHCDDAGYLEQPLAALTPLVCARSGRTPAAVEAVRRQLLNGQPAGVAAQDLRECLRAQLDALPGPVPGRALARRLIDQALDLLAARDVAAIARRLQCEDEDVHAAARLVRSLEPRPASTGAPDTDGAVVPDVVVWQADAGWRVALNPAATPRVSINAQYERALADGGDAASPLRGLLQEARWFTRGLSMRYDTLLRTARVIVERQAAFLDRGDEAMAPLTLKEVADAIGMHESTVSRITTGKYLQTPRGTIEMKRFFAVRLEGANVSGAAVRAMVRRLIETEPTQRPLADEAIATLLARQGVHIARRTVAKYREQLDIAPARTRGRRTLLARAG